MKAQFAAVDAVFLADLAGDEARHTKATVTLSGAHFYINRNGETLYGPLHRH